MAPLSSCSAPTFVVAIQPTVTSAAPATMSVVPTVSQRVIASSSAMNAALNAIVKRGVICFIGKTMTARDRLSAVNNDSHATVVARPDSANQQYVFERSSRSTRHWSVTKRYAPTTHAPTTAFVRAPTMGACYAFKPDFRTTVVAYIIAARNGIPSATGKEPRPIAASFEC